jgi:phosphohistidine phosphatase SixA
MILRILLPLWLIFLVTPSQAQSDWSALQNGTIVLFRHAIAPGTGDPPGFRLGDCSSQRNLDAAGRAQAKRIGEQFRAQKISVTRVLTSQWCRTRETAELAFPGLPKDEPVFNSFFGGRDQEARQTRAAFNVLQGWRGPGVLVVVTHQVNITALTKIFPNSGEGIVVRVVSGKLNVIGRVQP